MSRLARAAGAAVAARAALAAGAPALATAGCGGAGTDGAPAGGAGETLLAGCEDSRGAAPNELRCTGLYADLETKTLSPRARAFAPANAFWSDGADKERWIDLPDGAPIDATSMDDWTFPVGTKAWKEIRVGGRRVETRFWWKVREDRWLAAAYEWSPDERTARRVDGDDVDLGGGARWRIPKPSECDECHSGRKDRLLGFEAVSLGLPGASGLTLGALAAEGRLAPAPSRTQLAIPDDGTGHAAEALGWLHVNCGTTCHNATTSAKGYSTRMRLRLSVADLERGAPPDGTWDAVRTTVGVAAFAPAFAGETRIVPGDPGASLLLRLPRTRGTNEQMPPIATDVVDGAGTAAVEAWIAGMKPHDGGLDRRALVR
jgi:hypothetical protein